MPTAGSHTLPSLCLGDPGSLAPAPGTVSFPWAGRSPPSSATLLLADGEARGKRPSSSSGCGRSCGRKEWVPQDVLSLRERPSPCRPQRSRRAFPPTQTARPGVRHAPQLHPHPGAPFADGDRPPPAEGPPKAGRHLLSRHGRPSVRGCSVRTRVCDADAASVPHGTAWGCPARRLKASELLELLSRRPPCTDFPASHRERQHAPRGPESRIRHHPTRRGER